jgi:hypothetical protein
VPSSHTAFTACSSAVTLSMRTLSMLIAPYSMTTVALTTHTTHTAQKLEQIAQLRTANRVSISETDGKQKLVVNFDAAGCSTKDEDAAATAAATAAAAAAAAVVLSPRALAEEQAKFKARKALGEFMRRAESELESARRLMESMEKVCGTAST